MANDVLPRHLLIGAIVFVLVIAGGVSMLGLFNDADSSFLAGNEKYVQFNESFNKLEDVTNTTTQLQGSVQNATTDFGLFGVLNSLIATSWNTLTAIFTSFDFFTAIFGGLNVVFEVPLWITGLVGLIIIVILVFAIWSAIFQREI